MIEPIGIFQLLIIILGAQASPCIHIVGSFGMKSFYVGSQELNWFESLEYCHKLGMSLAVLNNSDEVDVITQYLKKCPYKHHVWVAGTDLMKEGTFTWLTSGKKILQKTAKWLPGQPDGGIVQNCLLINGVTGKWEDQSCRFQYCRPLCQNLP